MKRLHYFRALVLSLALLASSSARAADSIWVAHAKLVAAEQTTDIQIDPVFQQLSRVGQHTDASLETSLQARQALEKAQDEFVESFNALTQAEKDAFIAEINRRPSREVLIYDFEPISGLIPRIAEIRREQEERLYFPFGRAFGSAVQPRQLPTGTVVVDYNSTAEINGANFGANQFALTFDDGPHPSNTSSILQSLASWGLRVNFFQCGRPVESVSANNPGLLGQMLRAGHDLGSHSWSHPQMPNLSLGAAQQEIQSTQDVIEQNSGSRPGLFRFPYGARNESLRQLTQRMGYVSVMWNIDTLDWKYRDPATIIDLTAQQISQQGRGIILMHDIHTQTTLAVPHIIQILGDRGATVVQIQPRQ